MATPSVHVLLLAAVCAAAVACGDDTPAPLSATPSSPVLVIGVDGLEWSVLHPLLADGRCPNLEALMQRGSYGSLATFIPTWSPVIWTTIATGKTMKQHGITNFVDPQGREFTSARRAGRALWNVADAYGLTSNVFGWWITWPVEPIAGVMVSATSAAAMIDKNWKPALMEGLSDQVHPPELEERVMAVARRAGKREHVMALARERVFGPLPTEAMDDIERKLVQQTLWSIQSDETYRQVALELLPDHPADLSMIYFGGPDVAGHRFWRQMDPTGFEWSGSSPEVDEALSHAITNYYVWVDEMIGELLAAVDPATNVIVLSDHGMHAVAQAAPVPTGTSGNHQDGAPGVIVAAGPSIAQQGGVARFLKSGHVSPLGAVTDVAPTVMGLLGIPPARDMAGRANKLLLTAEARQAIAALGMVASHDDGFREPRMVEVPAEKEAEFIQRMKELGYMQGMDQGPSDSVPVNPETYVPDTGGGTDGAAAGG